MEKNRVKEFRKLRKMTQVELAKSVGTSQGSIQKLENGDISLTVEWMQLLSVPLKVKPYELLPFDCQPNFDNRSENNKKTSNIDVDDMIKIFEVIDEWEKKKRVRIEVKDKVVIAFAVYDSFVEAESSEKKVCQIIDFMEVLEKMGKLQRVA